MVGYMGGKKRQSGPFAAYLNQHIEGTPVYWEPFCGMCSVGAKIKHKRRAFSDINPYLIALHKAMQEGWIPPTSLSLEEWEYLRANKDENPALTGFAGFGCSFGGRFFQGYGRMVAGDDSSGLAARASRSMVQQSKPLKRAVFRHGSYNDFQVPEGALIYADPPYEGATKFGGIEVLNHKTFWADMEHWSSIANVFVSAFEVPDGWEPVVTLNSPVTLRLPQEGDVSRFAPQPEYLLRLIK